MEPSRDRELVLPAGSSVKGEEVLISRGEGSENKGFPVTLLMASLYLQHGILPMTGKLSEGRDPCLVVSLVMFSCFPTGK